MFSQALTTATTTGRGNRRGYASGFRGLSGLGALSNSLTYTSGDIRQIQNALNGHPTYLPRLAVDGVMGPKTIERIMEFQAIAGYPATGSLQPALLVVLGLSSGGGAVTSPGTGGAVGAGASVGGINEGNGPGFFDYIASIFSPITSSAAVVNAAGMGDVANAATNDAINAAKTIVQAGADTTGEALQFLKDNGDLFAAIALGLGVSYGIAQALALGGGGFLLVMLLKKR